jgi:uncharacterized protein
VILESIVTTVNDDGSTNVSPMGPLVDREITRLVLRPYRTSRTYRNLKRIGKGIVHVTDDVELLARAAIGQLSPPPAMVLHEASGGHRLADCCRWFAFEVTTLFDQTERTTIECRVVDHGRVRDFFGFNRAKHAVVEAAILATRLHILPEPQIREELARLAVPVEKTAGDQERRAFDLLRQFIEATLQGA